MKYKVKKLLGICFFLGAAVLSYQAYQQWKLYDEGSEEYKKIIEKNTNEIPDEDISDKDEFSIDWDSLKAKNPDIVGWIRMDPSVNYPIVQGTDNAYYLTHGFNRTYNINGSIFMHCDNKKDWSDRNTIIYGHNMISGEMFGNNKYYQDKAYTDAHPYFYIYIEQGFYKYKILDTITAYDATDPYEINLESDQAFNAYLKKMSQIKDYGTATTVSTKDRIVTLSTCTNSGQKRFIIQGVLESFTDRSGMIHTMTEEKEGE